MVFEAMIPLKSKDYRLNGEMIIQFQGAILLMVFEAMIPLKSKDYRLNGFMIIQFQGAILLMVFEAMISLKSKDYHLNGYDNSIPGGYTQVWKLMRIQKLCVLAWGN